MSPIDPRTPVLIGVGTAAQRIDDPVEALDVVALMVRAARAAAADAGAPVVLGELQWVAATKGSPRLDDPARLVADAVGSPDAHTVLSDIGVLQTTPLAQAAQLIAAGDLDTAMVCGGETKYRSLRAQIEGIDLAWPSEPAGAAPDEHWTAGGDILAPVEIERGLYHPVQQYAMIENALRAAEGQSIDDHVTDIAELYQAMNRVAATNPEAAFPQAMDAAHIAQPGPDNRPLAFPYNKWHNSQWNVDQAAALLLCSAERAAALGVARDQWVFPWVAVENNHMEHLVARADVGRCVGFEVVARRLYELTELTPQDLGAIELYSCFPVAVRIQQRAFAVDRDRPVTVTGGMAFAGGPLNNFVLQALARLAAEVRHGSDPGLVTAVSGMLTKQGALLLSSRPPASEYRKSDVSRVVASATSSVSLGDEHCGHLAAYTVVYDGFDISRTVALIDLDGGGRTLASTDDPAVGEAFVSQEAIGSTVTIDNGDFILSPN